MSGFDCHAHVYDLVSQTQGSNYRPSRPAPLSDWRSHLQDCGLRGGVLVQPSFLGVDNSQLLDTLASLGDHFRGVAQLSNTTPVEELSKLNAAGIVGVRWNLIENRCPLPDLDDPQWITFLDRIKAMDWHLEIHLEGQRLPELFPTLHQHGVTLVVDHIGLPSHDDPLADPGFRLLLDAGLHGRTWVKLSAPYRSRATNPALHVQALLDRLGPERLVWGSDWPWTRHEGKHTYRQAFEWLEGWVSNEKDRQTILEHSPRQLFHFTKGVS